MPLSDYEVTRDKFELDHDRDAFKIGLGFPCNQCVNNYMDDSEDPCRACDHNINAVPEDDNA